jgi:hypothetical protein
MDEQTKHLALLYEEDIEDRRWIRASIARSRRELEEIRELSRKARKHLEAVVGPLPKG